MIHYMNIIRMYRKIHELAQCLDRIKQNVLEGLNVRILSRRMFRKICGLAQCLDIIK